MNLKLPDPLWHRVGKFSLKTHLAVVFAVASLLVAVIITLVVREEATRQIEGDIGAFLSELAIQMDDKVVSDIDERLNDMRVLALEETFRAPNAALSVQRATLERVGGENSPTGLGWVGFIRTTDGILIAGVGRRYEGVDFSDSPLFKAAVKGGGVAMPSGALGPAGNAGGETRLVELAVPVQDGAGRPTGVLVSHLGARWAARIDERLLRPMEARKGVQVFVLDGSDRVVLGPRYAVGQILKFESVARARRGIDDWEIETWPDGRVYLSGFSQVRRRDALEGSQGDLGWTVVVRQAAERAYAPVNILQRRALAWGAAIGGLCVAGGWLAARRIAGPLVDIAQAADRLRKSESGARLPLALGYSEIASLSESLQAMVANLADQESALRHANATLRDRNAELAMALSEKEVLLREVHHRVKNNLQIVTSLLQIEANRSPLEARDPLVDSIGRIQSMALVHEQLYRSGRFACIDAGAYLQRLCATMTVPPAVRLLAECPPVTVDLDRAIPLAMIVNEAVSNALKHAFPDGRQGTVTVNLALENDGRMVLVVRDDGIGLPDGLTLDRGGSLGFQIIGNLARQIDGEVRLTGKAGTRLEVSMP